MTRRGKDKRKERRAGLKPKGQARPRRAMMPEPLPSATDAPQAAPPIAPVDATASALPAPRSAAGQRATLQTETARRLAGGRLSLDRPVDILGAPRTLLAPGNAETHWRLLDLDSSTLDRISTGELLELLVDTSPDISRALWDFLRLCNPGWEAQALRGDEPDEAGQVALDAFIARLVAIYGSVDVVLGRLFIGAWLRGGLFAELVLDQRGRQAIDLATPDPETARFRSLTDPARGQIWQLCQYQGAGRTIDLDRPTIAYLPVDPLPGSPYGRPLAAPALFSSLFLLGLLHDLRRVVAQQGYPRIDIAVLMEKLRAIMPEDLADDQEAVKNWVAAVVSEVQTVYAGLEPDDAYIHTDVITVNRPVGAVDSSSLGAVEGLIKALERMITRALKTMPLLMADTAGASEANANRQWEVHAAGVKALQHLAESLLERLLTLALRAEGLQATVKFRFAELRAAELLRDAQTEQLQIANARAKYDAGYISQDEAAQSVTGHPADQPEPRVESGGSSGGNLGSVQAEPGGNRGVLTLSLKRNPDELAKRSADFLDFVKGLVDAFEAAYPGAVAETHDCGSAGEHDPATETRIKIIPEGADEPLPEVPAEVTLTDGDIRKAINAWDELMPDYAGLLEAVVIGQEGWDEQDRQSRLLKRLGPPVDAEWAARNRPLTVSWPLERAYGDDSPWEWDQPSKRYRNTETGRYMGSRQMLPLRDEFIDAQKDAVSGLVDRLADGEITTNRFVEEMRGLIKTSFIDEYALAHGGRHNMTSRDFGIVGQMCRGQYGYLNNFAGQINDGELSPAQIRARGRLYIEAAAQAYERAQAEVRGISGPHGLPAWPSDGTSACRTNCKCTWEFEETETEWLCTWTLHPAEHCADCLERAERWKPYVVQKQR